MATLPDSEVRRLYSWWWDSHISPKNSKWLKENLADMDNKIEAMVRLIEEDADSFARRAELFYKRRPELMKLLEQFYRAYRALAERYDHAAGALRQAHRTMAEAFPNQFHIDFTDEPPPAADTIQPNSDASHELFDPDSFVKSLLDANLKENSDLKKLSSISGQGEDKGDIQLSKKIEDLKDHIVSEIERANKAETEIQCLKETVLSVNAEKEEALSQRQESVERVSYLQKDLSNKHEDLKKLNNDMLTVASQLHSAEEQKFLLGKANKTLESELESLKHVTIEQQDEIHKKKEVMEKLQSNLEEEQQQRREAEMACQSLRKQCTECEEQMRLLTSRMQDAIEKLREIELMNVNLKQELQKIQEENGRLRDEKLSSVLKIIHLQDEVISLTNLTSQLEDEIGNREKQKRDLQLEISNINQDRNNIEQKYSTLPEEIHAVNINIELLQSMIKDLSMQNIELKESIKRQENETSSHLQKQRQIGTMSKDKGMVETSLTFTNDELERLREKVKVLEESCCHLRSRGCIHEAEKALLVLQVEDATQNMENLSKKNTCLESSLSETNDELNYLQKKLKGLEESNNSINNQESILLSEKNILLSQINNVTLSLKNMEEAHAELEGRYSNVPIKERDSMLQQMTELQVLLKEQKNKHISLMQLSPLEETIHPLQEIDQQREGELELVQYKLMNAQFESFILQKYLHEMKEENLMLSADNHKHQETLSTVQQSSLIQEKKIHSLTKDNEKLRDWIHQVIQILNIDLELGISREGNDESLVQLILREIKHLHHTISEVLDEKQHLLLEKSAILTLLEQFGVNIADLRSEKDAVAKLSNLSMEKLTLIQNRNRDTFEMNEKLKEEVKAHKVREEQLKPEVDILFGQLLDIQEAHRTLQVKTSKLHEENHFMCKKLHETKEQKSRLEDENKTILEEIIALDCLSVICMTVSAERELQLQLISNERDYLANAKAELEKQIQMVNEKHVTLEDENKHMKKSVSNLDECRRNLLHAQDDLNIAKSICEQLNLQIFTGKNNLLGEKDMNSDLLKFSKLKQARNEAVMVRKINDKKISSVSEDYACKDDDILSPNQANAAFSGKRSRSQKQDEDKRITTTNSVSIIQKGSDDTRASDTETETLFSDIQLVTMNAAFFKDKVIELIKACQSLETSMVNRNVLDADIISRNSTTAELKEKLDLVEGENQALRTDLNAHLRLLGTLCDDVAVLEKHTFSLAKQRSSPNNTENKVNSFLCTEENKETNADGSAREQGLLKLQDIHAKVKVLQKVVMDTENVLALERLDSNASLEAAWKEIEGLKSKGSSDEPYKVSEEHMKDIQLDIVLHPSRFGNGKMVGNADKNTDPKLDLWGKAEGVYSNQKPKAPLVTEKNSIDQRYKLEEVKKGKYSTSELVAEKELGINKLELLKKVESYQECRTARDRLSSDSQRLLVLQNSVLEMQKNIEASKEFDYPPRQELDTVKMQLKEAEGTITKLISVNTKLSKKLQDLPESLDNKEDNKDKGSRKQILVSERTQKLSEKIARLELELQKMQHTLLKANEEHANKKTKVVERRTGILLKEYLYGRKDSHRQKKGCGCGCMRPRTKGD